MGEVYRARDPRLGRDVAIKVLPADVARDADRRARFEREAHAVAALSHPNILALHDIGIEKDVSHLDVLTMAQVRWKLLASERFRTAVLLVFAGTAVFLALIGIFGLVSYTVAQRHREIGLRVALGATYSRVVALMLRHALIPAVLGIVAGIVGALAALGLFFCAAFVAALVPALRSFRVDPAVALRHE